MALAPSSFTPGSLYIAGFTQARAPHVALLISQDARSGDLVHIRIDRTVSPTWQYQHRRQKITGDMFLSSLLKIHDVSAGEITVQQLQDAAGAVPVPDNDHFGECGPWVFKVVEELSNKGLVTLSNAAALQEEFNALAQGSRAFARRDKFPNVAVSQYCI
ncbi:hypothetical protein PYCCODRAFT_757596 [Trametes coccinea BRFM310]|uniref:Uncharacterized protein n=1 Tax=Trametes coccinea (strain BRFM310) TaxID=1353009 RepID=A0A1Y2J025_TRAC3|nr:hypothetical protein PYCCODRAFT_757596 [Trametes coccinea BRFM310]